ncbi:hypothetical protein [Allostreptomyces psammosilenae]|uniref:Uncharacterized protein n=1 Tax=Allostreptomyces psammosilenae TaxID=1892865 RepID=A0A853A2Y8_9ACTN|nr:hypothetical protein [Allostreptomyces psammosilenae]NYI07234.1 hypothetical protein [Allostreptomyces psammosilenae]
MALTFPSLAHLALLGPSEVEATVEQARSAPSTAPNNWWEGVRSLAVGRYQTTDTLAGVRVLWGRVAIAAIHGKRDSLNLEPLVWGAEEANVRSYLIRYLGPDSSDSMLDPDALCGEMLGMIDALPAEVERSVDEWKTRDRGAILRMRRIKNLLTPLMAVREHVGDRGLRERLDEWASLVPRLP